MKRSLPTALFAFAAVTLGACSEQTQSDASQTAELAGDDIEANAAIAGEVIEEGAKNAAGAISEGASNVERHIEKNDKNTPDRAPILGDNLNQDQENPND